MENKDVTGGYNGQFGTVMLHSVIAQDLVKANFSGACRIRSVIKQACNALMDLVVASSVKNYADTIGKPRL